MRSKALFMFSLLAALLLGIALATTVVWNPARWKWADRLTGRLHKPAASAAQTQQSMPGMPGMAPAAETGIRVNPSFVQDFGVTTTVAQRGSIPVNIRTIGILAFNEKNIVSVNTKFSGWIEKANVNYVGQPVHKGMVLFQVYSPQLVTTEQEYLAAEGYLRQLSASGATPEAIRQAKSLLDAAGQRLRYWDITPEQIAELARSGHYTRTLDIVSPVDGIVTAKASESLEGIEITPGMSVFKIADLSTVWAQIEVYENQVRYLHLDQIAHIALDAFPGRDWMGKVIYIDPALNQQTRTLGAKVEIPNPDARLRPGMYANVEISVPAVSGVVRVPEQAVLHTGQRNVVIVAKSAGQFEPRNVQLGASGGGYTEVLHGIKAGELVVISSQFLIDSESSLQEALGAMGGMNMGPPSSKQAPGGATAAPQPGGATGTPQQPAKKPLPMPPMK
jgi:RND family efflux transporter MFP subunit